MKIVILDAGIGSRLDNTEDHLPKALVKLSNGKTILESQLEALYAYNLLKNLVIVVGYKKELFLNQYPKINFVTNPNFARENTSKSLLEAISTTDDDVLWINGDVVFKPYIIDKVIKFDKTCMVVNKSAVGEEEVKYSTEKHGLIMEVSKKVEKPIGEALGINFFKQKDLDLLKDNLLHCQPEDYFETAIQEAIFEGLSVWALEVPLNDCTEIDFPEDLARANKLIESWSKTSV